MIALTTIIYVGLVILFYRVWKIKPTPTNVAAMIVLGVLLIGTIVIFWKFSAPMSNSLVVARYTVPIVPQIKGPVVKIHAEPNVPLKKGTDKLLEIQPDLYQLAVNQAKADLDAAEKNVLQAREAVKVAEATVIQSEANQAAVAAELRTAKDVEKRNPAAVARLTVEQVTEKFNAAQASVQQAVAAEDQARAAVKAAEAAVPRAQAQLDTAEFNLEQCTIFAPADGFVTNWQVREGAMAVPLPFSPLGSFIDTSRAPVVANFGQNVLTNVKSGQAIEVCFKSRPGRIYTGTVENIIQASGEGQFLMSGSLESAAELSSDGMYIVKLVLDDDDVVQQLAMGTSGSAVIYTDKGKPFQIISKVAIRMQAWSYYFFPF